MLSGLERFHSQPSLWAAVASRRLRSLIGQGAWSWRRNGWEDLAGPFWVCLCLFGGGGPAGSSCPPPGSAGLPRARRAGSLGTAIVRLHKHPSVCITPPPPLSPSSDPTGVAGWGAGWGPGCLGPRVSPLIHSLWPLVPPFCFPSVPTPPPSVPSSFIKRAFTKCLCVLSGVFLCYVSMALVLVLHLAAFS